MIVFLISWLIVGFLGSWYAIKIFRYDGHEITRKDLYLATLGPFFGPIIPILIFIDFAKLVWRVI